MILVNLSDTWPKVKAKEMTAKDATRYAWPEVKPENITTYGDTILGVYKNSVVTVYDIMPEQHTYLPNGRVVFEVTDSPKWGHLIGTPSPLRWKQGQQRPVQFMPTEYMQKLS